MRAKASTRAGDRVVERRRAVALARHHREAEGLSIVQIADRLGRSPATIKAYFYDPTGAKARAVKARYQGVCRGCGAYTQPRNGKGDAYAYGKACHPGAIERRWTESASSPRWMSGAPATGCCPRPMTGHARTRGGAGERRFVGWRTGPSHRPASSRSYSEHGPPPAHLCCIKRRVGDPSGTDLMRSQWSAGSPPDADRLATERSRIWRLAGPRRFQGRLLRSAGGVCGGRSIQRRAGVLALVGGGGSVIGRFRHLLPPTA
jgi:hypothetical protein